MEPGDEGGWGDEGVSGVHLRQLCRDILSAAFKVHSALGPGLLESAYEDCLQREFTLRGHAVDRQRALAITYEGIVSDAAYRLDLVVDDAVVIEIKSVQTLTALHRSQLLTYLKLSSYRIGFLMNFNVPRLKDGIRRLRT